MGLLDLIGLGGNAQAATAPQGGLLGADLYGDTLTPQQKAAVAKRRLAGFSAAIAPYLGYSLDPGKVGSTLQVLNAGLGGMGEAEDSAALNALRVGQLGLQTKELQQRQGLLNDLFSGMRGQAPSGAPATAASLPGPNGAPQAQPGGAVDKFLDLTEQKESGGQNIPQQVVGPNGGYNPSVGRVTGPSSAQGYYQIITPTWQRFAPQAGVDLAQYPTAMSAPRDVQRAVARTIATTDGVQHWTDYNPTLRAAVQDAGLPVRGPIASSAPQRPIQLAQAGPIQPGLLSGPQNAAPAPAGGLLAPGGNQTPPAPQTAPAPAAATPTPMLGNIPLTPENILKLGVAGDLLKIPSLGTLLTNAPAYKAEQQRATKNVDLEFLPREEAIKQRSQYLGPGADVALQGQLETAKAQAQGEQARLTQGTAPQSVQPGGSVVYPPGSAGAGAYHNARMQGQQMPDGVTLNPDGSVTVRGPSSNQEAFGKSLGDINAQDFMRRRQGAMDAAISLEGTAEARKLLDSGIVSGPFSQWKLSYDRMLGDRGIASNTETFVAAQARQVGQLIKQFGSGTGLSDADREYATKMAAGNIDLTEGAIRKILDLNDRASRNVINKFNADAEKVPAGSSPYPLTVKMPEQQNAAQSGAPAQAGAPVRVNTPAEAARLPSGTRFIDPNGIMRVVP